MVNKRRQSGISLLEILLILAIIGILLLGASPYVTKGLESYRQLIALNNFKTTLNVARSAANSSKSIHWICAADINMKDCAPNNQAFYRSNWLVKNTSTNKIIYKSSAENYPFYKTNSPKHIFVINSYDNNSKNASLLICSGFNTIKPKVFSISNTGNYRFIEKGAVYEKLVKKCKNHN